MTWTKEMWAISILSDAQELIGSGLPESGCQMINDAKRVLMGKYTVDENGIIKIQRGVKNAVQ
jgi:hypothetical protein